MPRPSDALTVWRNRPYYEAGASSCFCRSKIQNRLKGSLSKACLTIGNASELKEVLSSFRADIHGWQTAIQRLKFLLFPTGGLSDAFLPIRSMRNSDCDHALHHYTLTINRVTLPARGNVSSDRPFSECSETL